MKRTAWLPIALVLVVALLFSMFGCASPAATPTSAPAPAAPSSPTSAAPAPTTAAPAAPAPTAAAPASGSSGEAVTLNWVSFVPKNNPETMGLQKGFIDRVNETGKGKIQINFRGGPEAIASYDQGAAVKNGVVDMAFVPVGFYEPLVPGVGGRVYTSQSAEQQRKSGAYDYLQELHKQAGLYYLGVGRPPAGNYFYTYMKKQKVATKEDFAGLKIGSATAAAPAVGSWGATRVAVTMEEYFSAMERGVFDGLAGVPLQTFVSMGMHEVTKYVIDHPYYYGSVGVIMNLNTWNKLSPDVQKLVMDAFLEGEKDNTKWNGEEEAKARQAMADKGMEFIKFSPEVEKWYLDSAFEAAWKLQQERFPDVTPKLKEMLMKQID